jgi:hypothetical protein
MEGESLGAAGSRGRPGGVPARLFFLSTCSSVYPSADLLVGLFSWFLVED